MKNNLLISALFRQFRQCRVKIALILQVIFIIITLISPNYNDGASLEGKFIFILFFLIVLHISLGISYAANLYCCKIVSHKLYVLKLILIVLKYLLPTFLSFLSISLIYNDYTNYDYHSLSLLLLLPIMFFI